MKITFNDAAFAALRTDAAANALVRGKAEKIAAAANNSPPTTDTPLEEPYYEVHEAGDENRARYRIATTSRRASRHEAKTFALQQALSSDG